MRGKASEPKVPNGDTGLFSLRQKLDGCMALLKQHHGVFCEDCAELSRKIDGIEKKIDELTEMIAKNKK